MTDKQRELYLRLFGLRKRHGLPDFNVALSCLKHPDAGVMTAHGHGGGGIGPYTFCTVCKIVVSKTDEYAAEATARLEETISRRGQ